MNTAIKNLFEQYVMTFIEEVSTTFDLDKTRLEEMWTETQKKKHTRKNQKKKARAPSAYILFCKEHRPALVEKGYTFADISPILAKMWKETDEKEKEKYKQMRARLLLATPPSTPEPASSSDDDDVPPPLEEATVEVAIEQVATESPDVMDTVMETVAEVVAPTQVDVTTEEEEIPKKKRKLPSSAAAAKNKIPDDITDERDRDLWCEFADLTVRDLRQQCENFSLTASKKRDVMIRALITHRKNMEDNHTMELDEEEED